MPWCAPLLLHWWELMKMSGAGGAADLKTPSWHEVLHALAVPANTFPDSQSLLFSSLRWCGRLVKDLGFGVRSPRLNSQFQHLLCYLTTHGLSLPIYGKGILPCRTAVNSTCRLYRTCLWQHLNWGLCTRNYNYSYNAVYTWMAW